MTTLNPKTWKDESGEVWCEFCAEFKTDVSAGICLEAREGLNCTRRTGHLGDHVACGSHFHPILVWSNDRKPH